MRFVHLSDVHWGMMPDPDKHWSSQRANDIKQTFAKVIAKTKELQADLMFISGDLFHRSPLLEDLQEICTLFNTIPYTRIIIVAGAADYLHKNSNLQTFEFPKNVYYVTSEDVSVLSFPELNVDIHAFSYYSSEVKTHMIDNLNIPRDEKTHIVVAYGGDTNHMPIDVACLASQNVTYYALGSMHKPTELIEKRIVYPGCLEPLNSLDQGDRGIYIGDVNTITKQVERIYFYPMSKTYYINLSVTVNPETTNDELMNTVLSEIRNRGIENIYKLRISGRRNPKIYFDFKNIEQKVRLVDIIDDTEPEYNFKALINEHPEDIIGYYIQSFTDVDQAADIEKKALYYGIKALLKQGEVN